MLSQKHCFSVMETGSSQHGSDFGYRGADTWGQHDGQPLLAVLCPWTTRVQAQGVGVHWEVSLWSLHGQSQRREPVLGNEPSPQQTARGRAGGGQPWAELTGPR